MAHVLATQVSQDDEKNKPSPAVPAVPPKKAPVHKKSSCWWRLCCCCKYSEADDEPPKPVAQPGPVDKQPVTQSEKKRDSPKPVPSPGPGPGQEEEPQWLLDPQPEEDKKTNKKTLVLDLDETLVHSSFTYIPDADFIIEIELDGAVYKVYVRKRPGVDEFMRAVGKKFEVVVFTASLAKYADPLLDILDKDKVVGKRLFREACVQHYGNYVKDLSLLGRKLENSIIIDNSPFSYMFQPDNAIPITSWFNDKNDRQLLELLPFLDSLVDIEDVSTVLGQKATA
jgi:RNA polymerase II subunit A small phosphatase-like protein